jgi:hypothetical protein
MFVVRYLVKHREGFTFILHLMFSKVSWVQFYVHIHVVTRTSKNLDSVRDTNSTEQGPSSEAIS